MRPRVIPCLLLKNHGLVKTINFKNPRYLGDPINTVRIFNNKEVDEICILDITATRENKAPDIEYLKEIAGEAFIPLSYGGGITSMRQVEQIFHAGYEKVIMNTALINQETLVREAVAYAGSQSIVASIDVKRDILGKYKCYIQDGTTVTDKSPVETAKYAESLGAGEILLNSISCDGRMKGYDISLVQSVAEAVDIPVIACGGAKDLDDIKKVITEGHAHAAAAGSFFVYYGTEKAVLISYPAEEIEKMFPKV